MTTKDAPTIRNRWEQLSGRGKVGVGCGALVVVAVLCVGALESLGPPTPTPGMTIPTEPLTTTDSAEPATATEAPTEAPESTVTDTSEPPTEAATNTPEPPTEAPTVEPPTWTPAPPTEAPPTSPPTNPEGAAPIDEYNCPPEYPIKGNIGSNGNIYHKPGWRSYDRTKPERCFATEADAQAAGFRAPKNP